MQNYGLQLYSVRDITVNDLSKALEQVAALGYKEVEFAGFFGHSAEDVKDMLDKNGLTVSGTHSSWEELTPDKIEETVKYHKTIGNHNFIFICHSIPHYVKYHINNILNIRFFIFRILVNSFYYFFLLHNNTSYILYHKNAIISKK